MGSFECEFQDVFYDVNEVGNRCCYEISSLNLTDKNEKSRIYKVGYRMTSQRLH